MIDFIKKHFLPILLVIGGIIDQSTDLFVQLLNELNAPSWVATLFRIAVISFGAFRLYYATAPKKRNTKSVKKDLAELKFIENEQVDYNEEQQQAIQKCQTILDSVELELIGTRPKDR